MSPHVFLANAYSRQYWGGNLRMRSGTVVPHHLLPDEVNVDFWVRQGFVLLGEVQVTTRADRAETFLMSLINRVEQAVLTGEWPRYVRPPFAEPNAPVERAMADFWAKANKLQPLPIPTTGILSAGEEIALTLQAQIRGTDVPVRSSYDF